MLAKVHYSRTRRHRRRSPGFKCLRTTFCSIGQPVRSSLSSLAEHCRDVIGMVKYWGGFEVHPISSIYRKSSQSIQHCQNVPARKWDHTWWSESSGIVEIDPGMPRVLEKRRSVSNSKITPKTRKSWFFDEEKRLVREKGFWSGSKRNTTKFVSTGITEQLWWSTLWCSCNQLTLAVGFQIPGLWRNVET